MSVICLENNEDDVKTILLCPRRNLTLFKNRLLKLMQLT